MTGPSGTMRIVFPKTPKIAKFALHPASARSFYNDTSKPEFDGHYADDVSVDLTVIPEPTALAIWGALSAFGLVAVRRRPCRSKNR